MSVCFTKENQDLVIQSHNGRLEEAFCLSLFLQIQSLHYFVTSDQIGDPLKTFEDDSVLLHVRDGDLWPVTLGTLTS